MFDGIYRNFVPPKLAAILETNTFYQWIDQRLPNGDINIYSNAYVLSIGTKYARVTYDTHDSPDGRVTSYITIKYIADYKLK
jgi:hypothetical protein